MNDLARKRCLNHGEREAAARCPRCRDFFCRECVSEHDDQLVCALCLRLLLAPVATVTRRRFRWLAWAPAMAGVFLAWLVFYSVGLVLLSIDTKVHNGAIWGLEEPGTR
jgi:hypothetical protein